MHSKKFQKRKFWIIDATHHVEGGGRVMSEWRTNVLRHADNPSLFNRGAKKNPNKTSSGSLKINHREQTLKNSLRSVSFCPLSSKNKQTKKRWRCRSDAVCVPPPISGHAHLCVSRGYALVRTLYWLCLHVLYVLVSFSLFPFFSPPSPSLSFVLVCKNWDELLWRLGYLSKKEVAKERNVVVRRHSRTMRWRLTEWASLCARTPNDEVHQCFLFY